MLSEMTDTQIKSRLWSNPNGFRWVKDVTLNTLPIWNRLNLRYRVKQPSVAKSVSTTPSSEQMLKQHSYTLGEFYNLNLGLFVTRQMSSSILKFARLPQFLDCTPNKSVIANDSKRNKESSILDGPLQEEHPGLGGNQLVFSEVV